MMPLWQVRLDQVLEAWGDLECAHNSYIEALSGRAADSEIGHELILALAEYLAAISALQTMADA